MRLVVQSLASGRFLVPSLDDGSPEWVASLRDAGGGVVCDPDQAMQLVEDCTDPEDRAVIVDLERLGTAADYAPAGVGGACDDRAVAGVVCTLPVGNHGDHKLSGGR